MIERPFDINDEEHARRLVRVIVDKQRDSELANAIFQVAYAGTPGAEHAETWQEVLDMLDGTEMTVEEFVNHYQGSE